MINEKMIKKGLEKVIGNEILFTEKEKVIFDDIFEGNFEKFIEFSKSYNHNFKDLSEKDDICPESIIINGKAYVAKAFLSIDSFFKNFFVYFVNENEALEIRGFSNVPYFKPVNLKEIKERYEISLEIKLDAESIKFWYDFTQKGNDVYQKISSVYDKAKKLFYETKSKRTFDIENFKIEIDLSKVVNSSRYWFKINGKNVYSKDMQTLNGNPTKWFKEITGLKGKKAKEILEKIFKKINELSWNVDDEIYEIFCDMVEKERA